MPVGGIHHVTAIAGDAQENVDFYAGLLGMRLVKRSVNQDDPGTYHLFYADAEGHPGSDLTFFPWPGMGPGRLGTGLANEVVFAVPPDSIESWRERLEKQGTRVEETVRFGETTLTFPDVHGLRLAMTGSQRAMERRFTPWRRSPIPVEQQIRGIHAVRVVELTSEPTKALATNVLGMTRVGAAASAASEDRADPQFGVADEGWERFAGRDPSSGFLDVASKPSLPRGAWGVGTVHHVAWRATDDVEQVALQHALRQAGISPTEVIDRFWFHSVYFREPGGVLFEIATDGPGFGVDEDMDALGEKLVLPPWLEAQRAAIEAGLPPIALPYAPASRKPPEHPEPPEPL